MSSLVVSPKVFRHGDTRLSVALTLVVNHEEQVVWVVSAIRTSECQWDYSQSALYMITICVNDRSNRFGEIDPENAIHLSLAGKMVTEELDALSERFSQLELDTSVVMPNHVHILLGVNLQSGGQSSMTLGRVIGAFKSATTVRYIRGVNRGYLPPFHKRLWQAGYYETVIRNDRMAEEYRYYISNNSAAWEDDLEMNLVPESTTRVDATR